MYSVRRLAVCDALLGAVWKRHAKVLSTVGVVCHRAGMQRRRYRTHARMPAARQRSEDKKPDVKRRRFARLVEGQIT